MSRGYARDDDRGSGPTLESGLEALHASPEFSGPVEQLDGHRCNDHFAHIYETSEEKFAAAIPFVRHGLDRGERLLYVVDESTEAEVRAALRDGGIDVDAATDSGALTFHTVQETYLRNGAFDVDEMIEFYGDTVAEATEEYAALRIVAEMTWIPDDDTSVEQFMEYEQKVNELFDETESLAICQYNRDLFAPEAVRSVVQSHPHLIYEGAACHNFYYTPPEEFFGDDAPARQNERMLRTLRERTEAKAELRERERFLEDLYDATADTTRSFEATIRRLLELGSERFDLDIGYFTQTTDDAFEIVAAVGDHDVIEPGLTGSLSDTYGEKLLASPSPVAVRDAAEGGWIDDAAYERFGLDAYFAMTVHMGGEKYGTLCFASETPHEESFSDADRTFLDLMGQWIEAGFERQHRERFLRESYRITSDPKRSFEEKLEQLLDLGCDWMGLDAAGLTHLPERGDEFFNEYTVGYASDADGGVWTDPGEGCYCRQVIDSDDPVGMADVRGTDWQDDEIHREHGLSCYLGTKVTSGSTPYGTLWVGSTEPRDREFTETERTFLELIGQWVSYELERREHIQVQRDLYEITSDSALGFDEKLQALFDLGCEQFGLELGAMAEVDPDADRFEVEHVSADHDHFAPGVELPLSETYCTAATDTGEVRSVDDPVEAGYDDIYVHDEFDVKAYLGTYIEIEDDVDRTFFFVSEEPRDEAFSADERTFQQLLGQWVKYELERRQRERELRERTEHLGALVETTPECIKTVAEDGTLLQMNPAGLDMVEADAASTVTGENVYDLIAPEHRDRFREFNERICQGERGTLEFDIIGLEGTRRHMETHAAPLRRPDGTTVQVALTRDITEQKEREAELRRTKNRFETVFEQSDDAIFLVDPDADEFVDANPAACEQLGYARDELLSMGLTDLHPDEMDRIHVLLDEVRDTGSAWSEDLHCRTKGGEDLPAEVSASTITLDGRSLVLANVRYVEERKKHERYQRELQEIIADSAASFDEKIAELLDVGRDRFGLEIGYFSHVNGDAVEIVEAVGSNELLEPGAADAIGDSYCGKALASSGSLAVRDAAEAEWTDDHAAYETFGFDAYLGTTVHVGGDEYGTLCFASETPRNEPFTEAERTFLDLMGELVSYELERRRRERFLRDLHEVTAAPDLDFEAKLEQLLEVGRERFGLEMAGLNHLPEWDGKFRLEKGVGLGVSPEEELWTDPGNDCYCRRTIAADESVGRADVRGTDWTEDPVYREFGVTSYLGTKVSAGTAPYGTLWFGSTEPRDHEFSEAERSFLELMGQWVSYELERREHSQSQRELYEITADSELATAEKIERLLDVGRDRLDLPVGMLTHERESAFEIEQMFGSHPDLGEGTITPPMTDNYCRRVVDTGESISVGDAGAAGWDGDALYHEFDLQCYAGTQVTVGGDAYGTVCFTDTSPREEFTDSERAFLDLLGQCVSYELERATREDRLHALSQLGRQLLDTETAADVADRVVDTVENGSELPVAAAVALYDDETGELRPAAHTDVAAELVEAASLFDAPDGPGWSAFVDGEPERVCDPLARTEDAPGRSSLTEIVVYPLGTHGVFLAGATAPNGFLYGAAEIIGTAAANIRAALARADREQALQEREDTLEEQNQTLSRLNRINDTIRSIDQALVEADTRDEIERVVCEELADSGPYEMAWIGDHDSVAGEVTPSEWAGAEKGYLDDITIPTDDAPEGGGPTGRAVETGEPQVVNNVLTNESFAPWRQDALNRGYHATAALPLTYEDTRYGVLNLYAGQPEVFDDLEREVLSELSNTVAYAINAVESKKALVSAEVTELDFRIEDGLPMLDLSSRTGCGVSLETCIPQTDGSLRVFFSTWGAPAADVLESAADFPADEVTPVTEYEEDGEVVALFEASVSGESLCRAVLDHGGVVRRLTASDGKASVSVELPSDANLREFVDMFRTKFSGSELLAQRTHERDRGTLTEFSAHLREELTERQLEVLKTAYYSGFFETPRPRNGSEIAESLGVTQPTFNHHLRVGHRKLCRLLFEEGYFRNVSV